MKTAKIIEKTRTYETTTNVAHIEFNHKNDEKALQRAINRTERDLLDKGYGLHKGYKIVVEKGNGKTELVKTYKS